MNSQGCQARGKRKHSVSSQLAQKLLSKNTEKKECEGVCRRVVPTVRTTGAIMEYVPKISVPSASFNTSSLPAGRSQKTFQECGQSFPESP